MDRFEQAYQEGFIEGLEIAARATCGLCATMPPPTRIEKIWPRWWHVTQDKDRNESLAVCNAGRIHDAIAKRQGTNAP